MEWQRNKPSQQKRKKIKYIKTQAPLERFQADNFELSHKLALNGFKYWLTVVDHFREYAWCCLLQDKLGSTIRNRISGIVIQGVLKTLQKDNSTEFKNKELEELCKHNKINQIFVPPYYPQCQGAVEGFNKTVENALDNALYNHKEEMITPKPRN